MDFWCSRVSPAALDDRASELIEAVRLTEFTHTPAVELPHGRIAALIEKVSANRTVLMVEHRLSVLSTLSDHITVLARGEILAQGSDTTVFAHPGVVQACLGAGHG